MLFISCTVVRVWRAGIYAHPIILFQMLFSVLICDFPSGSMSLMIEVWEQVTARWRPEGACRPNIEDAPVFYPTEEVIDAA